MRILFAGTPDIAVPSLKLLARFHDVCGVLTNPDRPSGRGNKVNISPVKQTALELDIPVVQPFRLGKDAREIVEPLNPELLAVVAYSRIFGPKFLNLFRYGGINLHPSLLPKYRGPSPVNAAILNGDTVTGITVQKISLKMDSGDILVQTEIPLDGTETAESLTNLCAEKGAPMLLNAVESIEKGTASPVSQNDSDASYCGLLKKDDGIIDWTDSAVEIDRKIRGYFPWPGCYTCFGDRKLNILQAESLEENISSDSDGECGTVMGLDKKYGILVKTGHGILGIKKLQLQSKKAMDCKSFLNGIHDFIGSVLGGNLC